MAVTIPIADQIAEVKRELAMRRNVYPTFVAKARMTQEEASLHIARLEAALASLEWLRDNRTTIRKVIGQKEFQ